MACSESPLRPDLEAAMVSPPGLVHMSRRLVLAGGAASITVSTSGCFFLFGFLRVLARGTLIGRGARAARGSRRGHRETFGRLGAGALQAARIYRAANTLGRIARLEDLAGEGVAGIAIERSGGQEKVVCDVEGIPVASTRQDAGWFIHESPLIRSQTGVSRVNDNDDHLIEHFDPSGDTRTGFDKVEPRAEHGLIRHLGPDRAEVGTTAYRITNPERDATLVIDDDAYLAEALEEMTRGLDDRIRQDARDRIEMLEAQNACLADPSRCATSAAKAEAALRRIEARYL
jgi:hypothetical protein